MASPSSDHPTGESALAHSVSLLQVGNVDAIDEERRIQIATALRQYCETVSQLGFYLLRTVVESVEAKPIPQNVKISESGAHAVRMREISEFIRSVPKSAKSPRDLLDDCVRDEMIRYASLDGVDHRPVNQELRQEWFAGVRTRIAELNIEVAESPPADLEYLCTLVSGITGPGLPRHRESQQIQFLTPIEESELDDMIESVIVRILDDGKSESYNDLTFLWEDWEILVAFKIGGAPFWGGSYALYCRNEDHKEWKWRYGNHDGDGGSDVYDSVEAFLGFYA